MVNDMDVFLANEFLTASMLFIGEKDEKIIVQKIMKPRNNPELYHILNATLDVFQVKMAEVFAQMCEYNKMPWFVRFATFDKALQDYIEHVAYFNTIISQSMISSLNSYNVRIDSKYRSDWVRYYTDIVEPTMKKRFFDAHLGDKVFGSSNNEKIREEIVKLEKLVLKDSI